MTTYDVITDRITALLEAGTVPWHKTWNGAADLPMSVSTGRPYSGLNVFMLMVEQLDKGYSSRHWLTYNQAKKRVGCDCVRGTPGHPAPPCPHGGVTKGQKGTPVVFWKRIEVKDENDPTGKTKKTIPLLRYFTVFNTDQCEIGPKGNPDAFAFADEAIPMREHTPVEEAERIVDAYVADGGPSIGYGNGASYNSRRDAVIVPKPERYISTEAYYVDLMHELTHSTGHKDRLDRLTGDRFGTGPYSREELVAEMGACFLVSAAGLEPDFENTAAYIQSWLKALADDPRMIVVAAGAAQKATDLILAASAPAEDTADEEALAVA